jgi:predicted nucleic acid-binding protein
MMPLFPSPTDVVLETLNWLHSRKRQQTASEAYKRLHQSAGFEIIQTAQKDFTRAITLFEAHEALSFGDATIAAYMQRAGIEHLYSFDADFDLIEDITRLATPNNPFSRG